MVENICGCSLNSDHMVLIPTVLFLHANCNATDQSTH